ncbi:RE1-silencing transcription factor [Corythoichthys intestinalis]|uniref:RE1-silencing transcription factor n=1 Tax=Corythoichthys intestinalis TaxID=161448 RepID=UPI0025A59DF5|nr:RE1-silencing transcription factor [Corythoichthys intestinalis]XP_061793236.1 RE1-silencing transcription factor-like [Nerophis lumbriciformis]
MSSLFSMETFPPMDDAVRASAAPQLVMLANVADAVAEEKEMAELKTVACGYSDGEDDISYGYDDGAAVITAADYSESVSLVADGGEFSPPDSCVPAPPSPPVPVEVTKKKRPFHCKPCHFQAEDENAFVEHLRTHAVSKAVVGRRVEGRSKGKGAQEPAEEAAADAKGLIRCQRCGYNTNRYDHYVAHLKHHGKEGDDHRVFKCTLCAYSTVSQYHWRKHLRNHFPSKLHTCTQCSYFSDRKSNYIQHIRTHTGVRPFRCPYCDYSSSQKTHLTRHMRTHSGERPFKCESCNYLAANQHEVTRHARQVHNGPKPLACPYCEYKTADRSNFKKHVELHLNPRQFLCPLCKYAASKKCNLQYHIKSRHSGCDVTVDVSKVKLRVKKPEGSSAEELPTPPEGRSDAVDLSIGKKGEQGTEKAEHVAVGKKGERGTEEAEHVAVGKKGERGTEEAERVALGKKGERGTEEAERVGKLEREKSVTGGRQKETPAVSETKKRVKRSGTDGARRLEPTEDRTEKSPSNSTSGGTVGRRAASRPGSSAPIESEPEEPARRKGGKCKKRKAAGAPELAPESRRVREGRSRAARGHANTSEPVEEGPLCPPLAKVQAAEPEDDEGVHSGHEGGGGDGGDVSDNSDGASEGSDDSGLNGKMVNDSETPSPETPAPTEQKSHTCIFCDRHFPLESQYRRHLNRHLVNVYYMDTAAVH